MDTKELTNRMAHLVSLHEPRYGGPYQGYAAQQFVETMGEAMDALASQAAEIERLREARNFTLSDHQRLLRRSDVDGVCGSIDTCFEDPNGMARCGPCATKIAATNGTTVLRQVPKAPQEARLTRELLAAEVEIERLREALKRREAGTPFALPPEPVARPSAAWCDEYAAWYEGRAALNGEK